MLFSSGPHCGYASASLPFCNTLAAYIPAVPYLVAREYRIDKEHEAPPYLLSATSWLIFKVVDIFIHHAVNNPAVIVAGVITNILIIISILSAFPWVSLS